MKNTLFLFSFFIIFSILPALAQKEKMPEQETYSMLCLGDSYTIGERVREDQRFPNQAIASLKTKNIFFAQAEIIATTGWTTDELMHAIEERNISKTYDFVTLLIGVNNQYRGRSAEEYRKQFIELLESAIKFSGNHSNHVIVLSIPDWGVTPFAAGNDRNKIAKEIDVFNSINKEESLKHHAQYIDITPISRRAANDNSLVAEDGLHPSGKMYVQWAQLLSDMIAHELEPARN